VQAQIRHRSRTHVPDPDVNGLKGDVNPLKVKELNEGEQERGRFGTSDTSALRPRRGGGDEVEKSCGFCELYTGDLYLNPDLYLDQNTKFILCSTAWYIQTMDVW
jgi:hypothetical protein